MSMTRRAFLRATALAGGGFALGFVLPGFTREQKRLAITGQTAAAPEAEKGTFEPNAWIRITPDDVVTIVVDKSEMGQGVLTSIPMLIAEELDADWDRMQLVQAPANEVYANPLLGMMATGGSTSVPASWTPLRKAGAAARQMLVAAAAERWGVQPDGLETEAGVVRNPATGESLTYGELASAAAEAEVPDDPPLKSREAFRIIGKPTPRTDTPAKTNGKAVFGVDVKVPDMLIATVAHSPVFGGKVGKVNDGEAKKVKGVEAVVEVPNGVAVVARDFWTARKGLQALEITWEEGGNAELSTDGIREAYRKAAAEGRGAVAREEGDIEAALNGASKKLEAAYELPFAAHSNMEPMNCTAWLHDDICEVWVPTQAQTGVQMTAAKITGLPQEKVVVNTTLLGTGLGRRFEQDFVVDAVTVAKATGKPIKLIWTREEDMTHDFYRPFAYHTFEAGLDEDGKPVAWRNRVVTDSIMSRSMPQMVKDGIDPSSVEGSDDVPYAIPNIHVDWVRSETGVPIGFWRSVGHSQTAFAVEGFIDEVAHAADQDPYEFRRALLADAPRELAALELAAEKANWGKAGKGVSQGIAVHKSFGSYVAQVVDLRMEEGKPRVQRVVCAFDCGPVVNPDTVRAQAEGSVAYGLSAALYGPITVNKGRVEQDNFDDYPMLRLDEMPEVEVYLVDNDEPPSGVGEPAVPPVAPALANAIFAATGKRLRSLPFQLEA